MKTILWIAMILVATALSCMAAQTCDTVCMDSKISQMKDDLQVQVERIRRARDTADSQMTLARLRVAEQLRRSEEDLSRQIESLERYREQLADQRGENGQAVSEMHQDWNQFIDNAASNLHLQLQETNGLIAQMQSLRDKFDVDPSALTQPNTGQTMPSASPIFQPKIPAGMHTTGSQSLAPTVTLTTTVNLRSGAVSSAAPTTSNPQGIAHTATTSTAANAASP